MMQNNKSLRIRTNVGSSNELTDKYISVNLEQHYETLDILSLSINTEGMYRYHVSDYGVIVGRVIANGGIGVPNAKLSLFISKDINDDAIRTMIYPYDSVYTKNENGLRYNLLPDTKKDDCHQVIGSFPSKRMVLDDSNVLEIFDEYYKFTTRTNDAGDYMFFGIPTGSYTLHMDLDISDCGKLSQRPRDFVYKGYTIEQFENANQFKIDTELSSLSHLFTQDTSVEVKPFWGDSSESSRIGVTRKDIEISFKFEPTCVFMGSIVSDDPNEGITTKCVPTHRMGDMDRLVTGPGRIEIIRKKLDNTIEELSIKGTELIDGNGIWCFQIPMNLDYVVTDEYGNMVPTDNTNKGLPTRCEVRFRISMDETNPESLNFHRGKVLVPHNPETAEELDYNFGSLTKDYSFKSLMWNNVYTVKSFIPRFQRSQNIFTPKFTGIKKVNLHGDNNPMPYNNIRIIIPFMFYIMCFLIKAIIFLVGLLNKLKAGIMGALNNVVDVVWPYSYLSNEICPNLENWYFAPNLVAEPKTKRNDRTCRQWENQSVCETFKEIAAEVDGSTYKDIEYHEIKPEYRESHSVIAYIGDNRQETEFPVMKTITKDEYSKLTTDTEKYNIIYYKEKTGNILEEITISTTLSSLYDSTPTRGVINGDEQSIDVKNAQSKSGVRINLTNNVNYLMQCVESNLAQQYEIVKFDFYNDWINGCIYLPRWARSVTYLKNRKKGNTIVPYRIKGCLNGNSSYKKTNPSRFYMQQCSMTYDNNMEIETNPGCTDKKNKNGVSLKRCHHKEGSANIQVLGGNEGIVNETKTSKGENVYYLKPYEFKNNLSVPFFATDIVMLGTLNECNEYGLPTTFDSLIATTYQMPPQMALTNMENEDNAFFDLTSTAPTPSQIFAWQCNSKCNRGGEMVTGRVNETGVTKALPSHSDLISMVAEYADSNDEKEKWFKVTDKGVIYEGPCGSFSNSKGAELKDTDSLYYNYNGDNTYAFEGKEFKITKDTVIKTFYKIKNGEVLSLEYEDIFPVTEMAGVDWGYGGIGFENTDDGLFQPGGHFLGLSCLNSETTIKSCVNLQRACEIGTTLSSRFEIPYDYIENDDNGYDKVSYLFVAPNGLISKDQIVDSGFRSAFASMNQNSLKTKINSYGYKEYDFIYLLPDSFDGSLNNKINKTQYTQKVDTGYENYADWEGLGDRQHEIDIEKGFTIIRNSEIKSNDYITFRMGRNKKFLKPRLGGGGSMPVYRNSFYFYFGLKNGFTALDEFKRQFYAPCSKNVIIKETGSLNITSEFNGRNFNLNIKIKDLTEPYTYELYRNSKNDYEEYNPVLKQWDVVSNGLKEGELNSKLIISGITPGDYTLLLTDNRGRNISKNFNVGDDFFECDYTKKITDFVINLEKTSLKDSHREISEHKGGYVEGEFIVLNEKYNIDDTFEYRFKPMLRYRNNDNGETEEIVRGTQAWNKYYKTKEKRLYFWNYGTFELFVRAVKYNKTTNTSVKDDSSFQYKIDEFTVNKRNNSEYVLQRGDYYAVPSSFITKLEQNYGEWWKLYPFDKTSEDYSLNNEDEDMIYSLYKNVVAEKEGTHILTVKNDGGVEIFYASQMETNDGISETYDEKINKENEIHTLKIMNDKGVNRLPILITTLFDDNFATLSISDVSINDNILVINNPLNKKTLINKIENSKEDYEKKYMFYSTDGVGYLCELKLRGEDIIIKFLDEEIKKPKNGTIVIFNKLPILRNIFKFHFVVLMYNGNKKTYPEKTGIVGDSACYKDSFYYERMGIVNSQEKVVVKFKEKKSKEDGITMKVECTPASSFASTAEYDDINQKYNISPSTFTDDNIKVNNFVIYDKDILNDFEKLYILDENIENVTRNENVVTANNNICVEKISYKKEGNPNYTIDIINVLWNSMI